ncbi:hypothetical protein [Streptomyces sp. NRRL F-5123]|uniref:hypothetical protein n=1 Tax=Streptomyces sp. NRRL F-5123 TaxID=1463856 RepID=UPI00131C49F6|nr:hypothetical protein [Streptomyces sp. NRRL F-5123]
MRTSAAAAVVAAAALIATGSLTGTASAAGGGVQATLTPQSVPAGPGRLFTTTQIDAHVTWAGGLRSQMVGKAQETTPLLLSRDDRNGSGWQEVPLPAYGGDNEVNSIATVPGSGGRDTWVVGLADSSQGDGLPGRGNPGPILAMHWDGTSWQSLPAPLPADSEFGGFTQVGAVAADDVWAVGWAQVLDSATPNPDKPGGYIIEDHFEALAEHWDGHTWTRVAMPDADNFVPNRMAVGPDGDLWAAGYDGQNDVPVVQHWNGQAWKAETLPATGLAGEIYAIGVDASGTPWAMGRTVLTETDTGHALVLRKTGGVWRKVQVPASAGQIQALAFTPQGVTVTGNQVGAPDAYAMAYDGKGWRKLALPKEDGTILLSGASYSPGQGLTLVGDVEPTADPLNPTLLVLSDR